jgi:hypothetical protein
MEREMKHQDGQGQNQQPITETQVDTRRIALGLDRGSFEETPALPVVTPWEWYGEMIPTGEVGNRPWIAKAREGVA